MNAPITRHGFTLIELLVVIAIIAILAAILFPVFANARERARMTSCLNNMKQLGIGTKMYMDSYDDTYPQSGVEGKSTGWILSPSNFKIDVRKGQIYPYVKTVAAYVCPSDPHDGQSNAGSPTYLSYSMNGVLCSTSGERDPWAEMDQPISEADVPFPSETIMLLEESGASAGGGTTKSGGVNDGMIIPQALGGGDVVADRHNGGGTFVMADTRSKWLKASTVAKGGINRKFFWLSPAQRAKADAGKD